MENKLLLLLGLYIKEKGTFRATKWIEEFPSPEEILKTTTAKPSELKALAEKEIERAKRLGAKILFFNEQSYPEELRFIPYPPPFIYLKGELSPRAKFAIVGSRKPTPYGKEVAKLFAQELAQAGFSLVSGLARGIDTIVHATTLKVGGHTIAVIGSGLDVIYPAENYELAQEIVHGGGAIISEFPFGTKPRRENFPRRNRLISGLSKGLLVIEAGEKSGTLITAKWAQEQGKEVFAIPGNIFSEQSKGTHLLLKEGAIPVSTPTEILEYYGITSNHPENTPEVTTLSSEEEEILSILSSYPMHLEELALKLNKPVSQLLPLLTQMEMEGLIESLPGKFFCKKG